MKKIEVNRKSHPATFRQCKNLGQVIAVIEKEGEQQGLFVTKVYLNGKAMDSEEENLLDSLSLSEIKFLTFDLSSIEEIIKNSITDIIASIQGAQTHAIEFAREFRRDGKIDDEKVKFVLIECRSVIESLEEIFLAHSKQNFMIRHLPLWHEAEKELTNIIQCILQSRHMSDPQFLSDFFEYDLVQALDQWEEVLEKELLENSSFTGCFSTQEGRDLSEFDI